MRFITNVISHFQYFGKLSHYGTPELVKLLSAVELIFYLKSILTAFAVVELSCNSITRWSDA